MLDWNPKTREPAVSLLMFPYYAELRAPVSKHHALTSRALTDSELYGIVGLVFQGHSSQLQTVGARVSKVVRKPVVRSNRSSKHKRRVNDAAALATIEEDPLGEVSWSSIGTGSSSNSSGSSRISSRNRSGASSCPTMTPTRTPPSSSQRSLSPTPKRSSQIIHDVLKDSFSPSARTPPPRSRTPSPATVSPARGASPGTATPRAEGMATVADISPPGSGTKRAQSIWVSAVAAVSSS